METSSKTCVAVDTEQATLFVALELSQATWLVGLHSPIADKIRSIALTVAIRTSYWR